MEPAAPDRMLGGRYRLLRHLARGGMATVWLGEDTLLARRVAVKTLHPELSADQALRVRFRNEAISSASIEDPGIVAIYDAGDDGGVVYIVMEYVDGRDVRQLIDDRGPLPVSTAAQIAERVALALDQAHGRGIVHRDIKPANVLVSDDGRVKVTDFGIAKAAHGGDDLTTTGTVLGTARYLAPEQVRGDPTDARVDVYAHRPAPLRDARRAAPLHGRHRHGDRAGPTHGPTGAAAAERAAPRRRDRRALPRRRPRRPVPHRRGARDRARRGRTATSPSRTRSRRRSPRRHATRRAGPRPGPRRRRHRPRRPGRAVAWVDGARAPRRGRRARRLSPHPLRHAEPRPGDAPLPLVTAKDFDPLGDQVEDPHHIGNTIDNNPQTAWSTEIYATRNFGNAKAGVGIYVTLAAPATIHDVTVDTFEMPSKPRDLHRHAPLHPP